MNEGHSAFLALEQIRLFMRDEKLSFDEALEAARASNVFTTHTPVPAGIDLFDPGLMYHYFSEYCGEVGIDFQQLMALGPAQQLQPRRALLHGRAGAQHFVLPQRRQPPAPPGLAGDVPRPVAATAALGSAHHLHHQRRAPAELAQRRPGVLYDQYLQPDWRERFNDPAIWDTGRGDSRTRNCWKCTAAASAAW